MESCVHHVDTQLRNMDLTVVYTNDPAVVENSISTTERLLVADDKYKVVGFDLAYTDSHARHDQKFVNNPNYKFATADATNDRKVPNTLYLACQKLVDIHHHYKVWDTKKDKDSHVDLAEAIIEPYYKDMKDESDENKLV
ncbi:hypothetical protein D1007_05999 [Hordeum vulgare]|nr:hypothetical protein D1007_05999 [Hordeum vulgare]